MKHISMVIAAQFFAALTVFGGVRKPNYDKSKIAPYVLEDPLQFADGRKVATPADWPERRREILDIFADSTSPSAFPRSTRSGPSLGYVRRDLWHGHAYCDWLWLLDFADGFCRRCSRGLKGSRAERERRVLMEASSRMGPHGGATLPMEVRIVKTGEGMRLAYAPAREIAKHASCVRDETVTVAGETYDVCGRKGRFLEGEPHTVRTIVDGSVTDYFVGWGIVAGMAQR